MTWLGWRRLLKHRVLVTTKTDRTFSGVLIARRGVLLILKDASILQANTQATPIEGEVVIERSNVDFIQVVG